MKIKYLLKILTGREVIGMRSPLLKRLPREFKSELGKYIAIFLFMTLTIGFISGFLVAGSSMKKTYDDSFEKYNIENGHFVLKNDLSDSDKKEIEKNNIKIFIKSYKVTKNYQEVKMQLYVCLKTEKM